MDGVQPPANAACIVGSHVPVVELGPPASDPSGDTPGTESGNQRLCWCCALTSP